MDIKQTAKNARAASILLAAQSGESKNNALSAIARAIDARRAEIESANAADVEQSEREGLASPLLKRLAFSGAKIDAALLGLSSLISLPDPVGLVQLDRELDEGLNLRRLSCPIGVIGVIFESRPDALLQISSLCLKSGNAVILKGGSEARRTNRALYEIITQASEEAGMPRGWISLLETREEVGAMLAEDEYISLIIPRGSNSFVRYIMEHSRIPVMGHADGICHCYVDAAADTDKALRVVIDSKTQYTAVCNAAETLLVHEAAAPAFLPRLAERAAELGLELRGCERTRAIISTLPATEEDWKTEYLDMILSVRVVSDINEAIEHINTFGSGHTDAIITEDEAAAALFMRLVDSGNVFWNASTRFSDGFRYGFGAEVGISTSKLHARGPVGLEGLLIYKYLLRGDGHIVADYASGSRRFTHRDL